MQRVPWRACRALVPAGTRSCAAGAGRPGPVTTAVTVGGEHDPNAVARVLLHHPSPGAPARFQGARVSCAREAVNSGGQRMARGGRSVTSPYASRPPRARAASHAHRAHRGPGRSSWWWPDRPVPDVGRPPRAPRAVRGGDRHSGARRMNARRLSGSEGKPVGGPVASQVVKGAPRACGVGPAGIMQVDTVAVCSPRPRGWSRGLDAATTRVDVLPAPVGRGPGSSSPSAWATRCSLRVRGWCSCGECGVGGGGQVVGGLERPLPCLLERRRAVGGPQVVGVALFTTRVSSCSPLREAPARRRCRCSRLRAATRTTGLVPGNGAATTDHLAP